MGVGGGELSEGAGEKDVQVLCLQRVLGPLTRMAEERTCWVKQPKLVIYAFLLSITILALPFIFFFQ